MRTRTRLLFALALAVVSSPFAQGQACGSNPIVCENQLLGNLSSEWDISGFGDSGLQGFATEISVNKGETVHFKVDTVASTFGLSIYRLGYYGGRGARLVASQSNLPGTDQPSCLTQASTGLIDCGNWVESASWAVPATAVSGIYIAKLTRSGSSGSHIPFVVRDDFVPADIVMQTSDTTWQAYNTYGGNSLYVGGPGTNPGRAYKVSYNRPITTRGTTPEDYLFNAEYPMVRWLEANGYHVSYMSGVDTDRYGATELARHRVFLAVGHDEYWSAAQRQNVEAARDAGVSLAFLTGNGMFWKTRWESSIGGSATPYRTLVSYKETHANAKIDPLGSTMWTGTWRDPRFSPPADGGRPENALMGTAFTVNWGGTGSESWAIQVPQTFASHPIWRNTRIATLPPGGTATLSAGTLGYEWDENLNNGFRPAGIVNLSSTFKTITQKLVDYGSTFGQGTATHAMTLYRGGGNALVFGAGASQFTWGLDGTHDRGASTPDTAMRQAMVNLFYDMGVEPASLQSGLVSGAPASSPPTVTATLPVNGATDVAVTSTVTATFSEAMTAATVSATTFLLQGPGNTPVAATVAYNAATVTATLTPSAPLTAGTTYTATVLSGTNGVKDAGGIALASDRIWTFTTANAAQAAVASGLAIDAMAFGDRTSASTTVTTNAFSTAAGGEVLLAFVSGGWVSGTTSVSSVAGGGLTWTRVVRTNAQRGTAEVWRAFAAAPLNNVTVTATLSASLRSSLTVVSFTGADVSGSNASGAIGATATASAQSGAPSATLTTTRSNSWVFGVGTDATAATARTIGSGQTMVHQLLASAVADTYWVQRRTDLSPSAGISVTINDTAPTGRFNLSAVEILPALAPDTQPPAVGVTAPVAGAVVSGTQVSLTASASDDRGVVGVQFFVDGAAVGSEDTSSPYAVIWDSTTVANGSRSVTAVARDAAGQTTTSAPVAVTAQNVVALVGITSPANGATVGNAVTVNASTGGGFVAVGVQFQVDGVNVGAEDLASPFTVSFTAIPGAHTLTAVARDAGGNTTSAAPVSITVSATSGTALTVNGAQTFQTVNGLGLNLNSLSWKNGELAPALDMLIDQMGVTSLRVVFDMVDWEAVNDNADPAVPDWTYYNGVYSNAKFQNLWGTLHYLNQKGLTKNLMLSLMGRVAPWMGGGVINAASEDEWVEQVWTMLYYARNTEHVQFDLVDPITEPDLDGIEGPLVNATQYARLLGKLAVAFDAHGLSDLKFVAPNTADVAVGLTSYLPALMGNSLVMSKIDHFGFHNYANTTGGADQTIKSSAYPTRNFWMSEVGSPAHVLTMLAQNASAIQMWEGADSVYNHAIYRGQNSPGSCGPAPMCTTTPPNDNITGTTGSLAYNTATGVYTPRQQFYQQMQIFKYIPSGSVRIAATQGNSNLTMLAFYDQASGRVTIVGRNISGSTISVNGSLGGLPLVTTLQKYQTDVAGNNFLRGADVLVGSNGTFFVQAPVNSYFTLTGTAGPDMAPPVVSMTSPANNATVTGIITMNASAVDNIGVFGVTFAVDGTALGGEDTAAPYSASWNSGFAAPGAHVLTATARDLAGNAATASVTVNVPGPPPGTWSISGTVNPTAVAGGTTLFLSGNASASTTTDALGRYIFPGLPNGNYTVTASKSILASWAIPNSGLTTNEVGPWPADASVAALGNCCTSLGSTTQSFIQLGSYYQIRQTGAITSIRFGWGNASAGSITGLYFNVWRKNAAGTFDRVAESQNLAGSVAAGAVNTIALNPPLAAREGDYYGMRQVGTLPSNHLNQVAAPFGNIFFTSSTPSTPFAWLSQSSTGSGQAVIVDMFMATGPSFVSPSDSWFSGNPDSYSGCDSNGAWNSPQNVTVTIPRKLADKLAAATSLPFTFDNCSTSGDPIVNTAARYTAAALDAHPRFALLAGGWNDIWVPYTQAQFHDAWNSILAANQTAGIASVVMLLQPVTSASNTQHATAEAFNTDLKALIQNSYPNTIVVDVRPHIGQFRPGGPAGNLWDIQPIYDSGDKTHPNNAGRDRVAQAFYDAISAYALAQSDYTFAPASIPVSLNGADASNVDFMAATTPPTVAFTSPTAGATVSGTINVTATASDNLGVAGVTFALDDTNLAAEDTTAPYSLSWNTTQAALGSHTLTATARDTSGNTKTASITITVDNSPAPIVAITAPGAVVSGSGITVSATASDNLGVAGVTFALDGTSLAAEDTTEPYSIPWDTTLTTSGTHTLSATARSTGGKTTTTSANVTVDNTLPSVSVTAPGSGAVVGGSAVAIAATAADNLGVGGVTFALDGTNLAAEDTTSPYSISWNTTLTTSDTHTLSATARDVAGNTRIASINVTVDNTLPASAVTAPSAGATVSGAAVVVSATASDNGAVAGVQFRLDGANLGAEDTTAPYSITWNTTATSNGPHTLTAVARDTVGNLSTSAGVGVTVTNVVPTVTATSPASGATGVATTSPVTATFSEAMMASTISATTFQLRGPGSTLVAAAVGYNAATLTATLTPSAALTGGTTYTATVTGGTNGVKNAAGIALASDRTWTFTTATSFTCPCSLWTTSTTPGPMENEAGAVELGVKFTADVAGSITGLRFYKYAQNTGTHVGRLWTASGQLLATVTFSGETASGWQQATFATPVPITANTTYIASYHTTTGFYAFTTSGLTSARNSGPLHAPASGTSGGNGVYRYGAGGVVPNLTYSASNYWVDVVFTTP